MSLEEMIEMAVQDILQARTYISTNSIPVVRYRDRLSVKGDKWVNVHSEPLERLSNNHNLYKSMLILTAESKSQEDLRSNAIDAIISDLADELQQTMTATTLQTALDVVQPYTELTIDGILQTQGDDTDGDYQGVTSNAELFITFIGIPVNTVAPVASGTNQVGQTLTTTTGTWDGSPTSYTYQWQSDGGNIVGATSSTYVIAVAEAETDVRCVVTAVNAGGSTSANSNAITIAIAPPVNSVAPVASGTGEVAETLSTTNGSWTNTPTGYTYQWQSDTVNIAGATASTYLLTSSEGGTDVRCVITASNAGGSAAANSNAITVSSGYILDTYPAFAAYSTRKLSSTATNCMIVTEDGGGTEATIGFSEDWLNEAAIATHCGASTGSVAQWYGQGTGAYNVTQSTDSVQPEIYNGTSVYQQSSKPALYTQAGLSRYLESAAFSTQAQSYTVFGVNTNTTGSGFNYLFRTEPSFVNVYHINGEFRAVAGVNLASPTAVYAGRNLSTILFNGASGVIRQNGTTVNTGNIGTQALVSTIGIGGRIGALDSADYIQELIFMAGDMTANFAAIESDINAAFGVYA